jgi:hypothetical protein
MNKYLAKLHSLQYGSGAPNPETRHPKLPSKPSKPSFEGFEGDQGRAFFENGEDAATVDPCAKHMAEDAKNITPQYLQNFQNLGSPSGPTVSPGCSVTIIELPQAQRYRKTFAALQMKPPDLVDVARWRQAVSDASRFLARWGEIAQGLNWSSADLFGLIEIPEHPSPSFNRLSRYDRLGLCWALKGRDVIALTAEGATIRTATGSTLTFYRHGRPAYGPLGDSLDDIDPRWRQ